MSTCREIPKEKAHELPTFLRLVFPGLVGAILAGTAAAEPGLAERPPMGWNSWNSFGVTVNEAQVKANAEYLARHMKRHGWEYVVVDLGWYLPPEIDTPGSTIPKPPQEMDAFGRLLPDPRKFPSSAGGRGFKPLADHVHGLGLKFGIHIMRGIHWQAERDGVVVKGTSVPAREVMDPGRRCEWYHGLVGVHVAKPGGQEYYDSIVALYAEWGVDYIKADDMSRPYDAAEIEALAKAIRRSGRPIVLSLSPGATPIGKAEHVKAHAQLWRISPDFWDLWKLLDRQFELCRQWQPHVGPGHWPDADMLPLGKLRISPDDYVAEQMGLTMKEITNEYSRFTTPEKLTLLTLWSIFRSPLMMGGHLPENDPLTLELLTNDEVIAVNQASARNREVLAEGTAVAWAADAPDGGTYVALFNRGEAKARVEIRGSEVVKGWTRVQGEVWKVDVPNTRFGGFNPFADEIRGDWFDPKGRKHHTGAVYLDGDWLVEAASLAEVLAGRPSPHGPLWFAEVSPERTTIHAQFPGTDPNARLTEINVRKTVFYPDAPGRSYITVRGFALRHAATPWAPPTAEQVGLIGTHWSKGWVIEDNTVSHSVSSGIALGKHGDEHDNTSADTAEGYVETIRRAHAHPIPWTREAIGGHVVRRNRVSHCEQAGIVGSMGPAYITCHYRKFMRRRVGRILGRQAAYVSYPFSLARTPRLATIRIMARSRFPPR